MQGFDKALAASLALTVVALSADLRAQTAETMYTDMLMHEAALRRELGLAPQLRAQPPGEASSALLDRVRSTVNAYEDIVRRFPRSGYSDNALWQGGMLAADAFSQFGNTRDRAIALQMFERLELQYPSSSLIARIAGQTTRLNGVSESAGRPSTLTAIKREVLPDAVRITLELGREAILYEERLDGPPRLFLDLHDTLAVGTLQGATIAFQGAAVRRARIRRHPNNRTQVVFDLQDVWRYSVYSLFNPYRVVIDFEQLPTAATTEPQTMVAAQDTPTEPASKNAEAAARPQPASEPDGTPPTMAAANTGGGFSLSRQLGLGIARVVIDPGHGGRDPGARTRGLSEAGLVLDVAKRLERLLTANHGVEVVMTRHTNTYVSLEERTAIANRSDADLFLSIHANANSDTNVRGFATYFLNFAPSPEAEALAARENAASARTMRNLPDIVEAITLNNKIDESRNLAFMVQRSMRERLPKADGTTRDLGVKQAPFMVLVGATMPSVLTEVSFLTNRDEATLLRSQSYRQQIAEALLDGVMKYQNSLKKIPALRSGL